MRILIVKLSALGDVLHTIPALTTLRRHLPDAHLSWLVEDSGAGLLHGHPALNSLHVVPRQEWTRLRRGGGWGAACKGFIGFARRLRHERFDLVIDFQGLAKSGFWVATTRAARKAGFGPGLPRNEGAWLTLTERIAPPSSEVHALDRNLNLLERLGYPRLPLLYDLPRPQPSAQAAEALLLELGITPGTPFVAINAMTRWPTKNWTAEGFAQVADLLIERGMKTIFTGAPGDRGALDAIAQSMRRPASRLDGRTDLRTLTEIYRRARVVLSTDTGPMHLAAAVETPVVALFGPTAPWRTGPYGNGHRIIRTEIGCSPCFKRNCLTPQHEPLACMLRLDPVIIADAVISAAEGPRVSPGRG